MAYAISQIHHEHLYFCILSVLLCSSIFKTLGGGIYVPLCPVSLPAETGEGSIALNLKINTKVSPGALVWRTGDTLLPQLLTPPKLVTQADQSDFVFCVTLICSYIFGRCATEHHSMQLHGGYAVHIM